MPRWLRWLLIVPAGAAALIATSLVLVPLFRFTHPLSPSEAETSDAITGSSGHSLLPCS